MRTMLVGILVAFAAGTAVAGDLIPTDSRYGPLRVKLHKVETRIDNQVAITKVTQIFSNDNDVQLEAIYVFPTPGEATIIDFSMTVNGKLMRGELLEKNQARVVYEKIVSRAKDPGLLEQIDKNVFRMRVFPVLPRSEQKIELTYVERVSYEKGSCTWRYPLKVPGSKIETKTDSLEVSVRIDSQIPIKAGGGIFDVTRVSEGTISATLKKTNADLTQDLELAYTLERPKSGFDIVAHRVKDDGYFLMLVTPGLDAGTEALPKDMTFVFDTSGSMEGIKIKQAKAALRFCVAKLKPEDRFNIIRFSDDISTFRKNHVAASDENRKAADGFIDRLEAIGGTDIQGALLEALEHKPEKGRPHLIVFMTDGQPTMGERDPKRIVQHILAENKDEARIFTFGVGDDLNRGLLEDLAEGTRAVACFVTVEKELENAISTLQRRIVSPVLTNLEIDWGGADVLSTYPKRLPDLYAGVQLMVAGRYGKAGMHKITLRGKAAGKDFVETQEVKFPENRPTSDAIKYIWGARRIAELLDSIRRNGESREVVNDVVRLSREYRVATPYTSFLVLENEAAYDHEGIDRKGGNFTAPGQTAKKDSAASTYDTPLFFPKAGDSNHIESDDSEEFHRMKGDSRDFLSYPPGEGGGLRGGRTYDSIGVGASSGSGGGYGGRFGGHETLVARGGGTRATEAAVLAALKWLARHQNDDGSWSSKRFPKGCKDDKNCSDGKGDPELDSAVTGLSLLAFLGAGYTHLSKDEFPDPLDGKRALKFGEVVKRALQWIIAQQDGEGRIGPKGSKHAFLNHFVCALALSEAYGMTNAAILRDSAQRAVDSTAARQEWPDALTAAWAILLTKSAELSELTCPASMVTTALQRATSKDEAKNTRQAAIGVLSRILVEKNKRDPQLGPDINALLANLPSKEKPDSWTLCFGSTALFQYDGPDGFCWKKWNESMKQAILPIQNSSREKCDCGSWDPLDPATKDGGRVLSTALHALSLEVYYRYPNIFVAKSK